MPNSTLVGHVIRWLKWIWARKKRGSFPSVVGFFVWIIQIIASLFQFLLPAWSREAALLRFIFCYNRIISCNSQKFSWKRVTFLYVKKNHLIPNGYLFFYNFFHLFILIHSENIYWTNKTHIFMCRAQLFRNLSSAEQSFKCYEAPGKNENFWKSSPVFL